MDFSIYQTSYSGECDRCHVDQAPLYSIEDDEPGEWAYCRPCAVRVSALYEKRAKKNASRATFDETSHYRAV